MVCMRFEKPKAVVLSRKTGVLQYPPSYSPLTVLFQQREKSTSKCYPPASEMILFFLVDGVAAESLG